MNARVHEPLLLSAGVNAAEHQRLGTCARRTHHQTRITRDEFSLSPAKMINLANKHPPHTNKSVVCERALFVLFVCVCSRRREWCCLNKPNSGGATREICYSLLIGRPSENKRRNTKRLSLPPYIINNCPSAAAAANSYTCAQQYLMPTINNAELHLVCSEREQLARTAAHRENLLFFLFTAGAESGCQLSARLVSAERNQCACRKHEHSFTLELLKNPEEVLLIKFSQSDWHSNLRQYAAECALHCAVHCHARHF